MARENLGAAPAANNDLVRVVDVAELAQDAVGSALTDSNTIDFTYNDGANTITASAIVAAAGVAKTGSQQTMTTTATDLTGVTVSLNPTATTSYLFVGTVDIEAFVGSGAAAFVGTLVVDGSADASVVILTMPTTGVRITAAQSWVLTLAAGAHTVKMQGRVTGAGPTLLVNTTHTTLRYFAVGTS